jgi:hypothetical protein
MNTSSTFKNPHDAAKYVVGEIQSFVSDSPETTLQVARSLLQALSAEDLLVSDWPWDGVPRGAMGAAEWTELTVRASDLDLLKQLAALGGSLSAFLHTHSGGSTLLLAVLCALLRLRSKGFFPDPLQKRILITLRAAGPMTLDQLVEQLNRRSNPTWSEREVKEHLATLEKVHLKSGESVALVHLANGRWATDARGLWEVPIFADFPF